MHRSLQIAFFGSSLVSAYWNGAATYYRGLIRALHERGHRVTFFEPGAFDRQSHRDMEDPAWARVVIYPVTEVDRALEAAQGADVIVKASGVGVNDELLEREVLALRRPHNLVVFWDVDAPATLERVSGALADPFRQLIPRYDAVLTYGGGKPVIERYRSFGARACIPVYNGLDPDTHHPVKRDARFAGLLGFLGNRLPDRESRVREFFFEPARTHSREPFLLAGNGWARDAGAPQNVRLLGHLYSRDHNAFNCTPTAVININRDSMARTGFSPPTRVFEAAGAGACLIVDAWEGIEQFFEPGAEVLVAHDGTEVADLLSGLDAPTARRVGQAALRRALAHHTYARRALEVEAVLLGRMPAEAVA
ncbi:MAG TPA: glycosyltransferase [Steroidobacteraceae bacterium]|nr:glycosyltransferase [Steroidobacteraceae bacterium]